MSYYNLTYFIFIVPIIIISLVTQARVKSAYKKYAKIGNSRGLTGAMAAQMVLNYYGITNVRIQMIPGELTDNFNPKTNIISLSEDVYRSTSIAAVGVACHEAGHAAQYAQNYSPIKIRNSLITPANIGSRAAIPLALLGYVLGSEPLLLFGIILYAFIMLFQLFTLPVEFNASSRAIQVISQQGLLNVNEVSGAKTVLKAAAMTYVASFAASALSLLRLILLANRRR